MIYYTVIIVVLLPFVICSPYVAHMKVLIRLGRKHSDSFQDTLCRACVWKPVNDWLKKPRPLWSLLCSGFLTSKERLGNYRLNMLTWVIVFFCLKKKGGAHPFQVFMKTRDKRSKVKGKLYLLTLIGCFVWLSQSETYTVRQCCK